MRDLNFGQRDEWPATSLDRQAAFFARPAGRFVKRFVVSARSSNDLNASFAEAEPRKAAATSASSTTTLNIPPAVAGSIYHERFWNNRYHTQAVIHRVLFFLTLHVSYYNRWLGDSCGLLTVRTIPDNPSVIIVTVSHFKHQVKLGTRAADATTQSGISRAFALLHLNLLNR